METSRMIFSVCHEAFLIHHHVLVYSMTFHRQGYTKRTP